MKVLKCLVSVAKNFDIFIVYTVITRGGVEDTRLEAKDTKKIRGQGEPLRGQTLSTPRTGMLEANDLGHKRECSPKKQKDLHKNLSGDLQKEDKNFSGNLQKKGLHKNFSGDLRKKTFSKKFFRRSL